MLKAVLTAMLSLSCMALNQMAAKDHKKPASDAMGRLKVATNVVGLLRGGADTMNGNQKSARQLKGRKIKNIEGHVVTGSLAGGQEAAGAGLSGLSAEAGFRRVRLTWTQERNGTEDSDKFLIRYCEKQVQADLQRFRFSLEKPCFLWIPH